MTARCYVSDLIHALAEECSANSNACRSYITGVSLVYTSALPSTRLGTAFTNVTLRRPVRWHTVGRARPPTDAEPRRRDHPRLRASMTAGDLHGRGWTRAGPPSPPPTPSPHSPPAPCPVQTADSTSHWAIFTRAATILEVGSLPSPRETRRGMDRDGAGMRG